MPSEGNSQAPRTLRDAVWLIAGGVAGFFGHFLLQTLDADEKRNDIVIKKRMEVYDKASPELNDILAYVTKVGGYKDMTPIEIINRKRDLDKIIYSNIPYLSVDFFVNYNSFINNVFCTFGGVGKDAGIMADFSYYKESAQLSGKTWDEGWKDRFNKEEVNENDLRSSYYRLLGGLANEISNSLTINTGGQGPDQVKLHQCR